MADLFTLRFMYFYCISGSDLAALAFAGHLNFSALSFEVAGYFFGKKHLTQDTNPFIISDFY